MSKSVVRRIFAIAGVALLILLLGFGLQTLIYQLRIKKQGALLDQIYGLETEIASAKGAAVDLALKKNKWVKEVLEAEQKLFQVQNKLRRADRLPNYRLPLGKDILALLEELGKTGFILPEGFIQSVQDQITYFTAPANRSTLIRCFARKAKYEGMILQELARSKLPASFLYIAMQESLLDSLALSKDGARGLWQLVPETAREYDLQVPEGWDTLPAEWDERTRPQPSTRAAARYLRLLYSEFGDAALTLAAYNAGGNKLRRTLSQIEDSIHVRDFWYLYRMGIMQTETAEFVPKIIAMILIDRNREKYGFKAESLKAEALKAKPLKTRL